ncbi:hypothetical protein Cadr_000005115 [Camelus dromedarius]|uniref:Uncharacterized protein n=1 Tax=Camelus dromedarius TaxID=9838 RepID=A0A5N4ECP1_CAMDR|nr:hypothetical protein Cadr_000005115 [Camelus dromedarius]
MENGEVSKEASSEAGSHAGKERPGLQLRDHPEQGRPPTRASHPRCVRAPAARWHKRGAHHIDEGQRRLLGSPALLVEACPPVLPQIPSQLTYDGGAENTPRWKDSLFSKQGWKDWTVMWKRRKLASCLAQHREVWSPPPPAAFTERADRRGTVCEDRVSGLTLGEVLEVAKT